MLISNDMPACRKHKKHRGSAHSWSHNPRTHTPRTLPPQRSRHLPDPNWTVSCSLYPHNLCQALGYQLSTWCQKKCKTHSDRDKKQAKGLKGNKSHTIIQWSMNLIKHTKDHLPYSRACAQLCAVCYNVKRKNMKKSHWCGYMLLNNILDQWGPSSRHWIDCVVLLMILQANFKVASRRGSGSLRFAIISVVLKLGGETAGANQVGAIWWILLCIRRPFFVIFDEIATLETDTFILASAVSSSLSSCCQKMQLTSKKWKGAVLPSPS